MSLNPNKARKVALDRRNADQGDFVFGRTILANGDTDPRPFFVVGKNGDSNDTDDLIVCSCTKSPARTVYDVPVQLKLPTCVRTNKLYTIGRDQIDFIIKNHAVPPESIIDIIKSAAKAVTIK